MDRLKMKFLNVVKSINYETIIFVFLSFCLFMRLPGKIEGWKSSFYAINYSYGIVSRGFIGTLFNWLFDGELTMQNVYLMVFVVTMVFNFLLSVLLSKLIKVSEKSNNKHIAIWFVSAYLLMPFSFKYLYSTNFGRLDIFLYLLTVIQMFLLFKYKNIFVDIFVGILSVICVAIHEAYIYFVFPILFVLMVYNWYKNGSNIKKCITYLIVISVVLVTTLYFQFFSTINVNSMGELLTNIREVTDIPVRIDTLSLQYFTNSFSDHLMFCSKYVFLNIAGIVLMAMLMVPMLILLISLVILIFRKCKMEDNKLYKVLILMQIASVAFVPLFFITSDWGRWLHGFFNYEMTVIVCMILLNPRLLECIKQIYDLCMKQKLLWVEYLIFLLLSVNFTSTGVIELTSPLFIFLNMISIS